MRSPCCPAARSKRPRNSQAEPIQVWTAHQLGAFLTTAQHHRLFALYRLAAYTGARRGELLYLRWDAVNLDAAEITFGGSTAVVRGQRVEGTTKGGRSRTVSLDRDTVAVLREHRRQQAEERLAVQDVAARIQKRLPGTAITPAIRTPLGDSLVVGMSRSPGH
jgi:integrase